MLKVASYNIRKAVGTDRLRDPVRVLNVLAEIDADIVALQEADRRLGARVSVLPPAMIAEQGVYDIIPVALRPDSIGWHGNAILARKGAKVTEAGRIDLPTLEPRGAVFAELILNDSPIRVVAMHLDLSGIRRRVQAHAILQMVESRPDMPTVLMGDLNEWRPHGGCIGDFGHHFRIAPTGPSFHSQRPVARLDRIMTSRSLHIDGCGVHHSLRARSASDHLPIWARLSHL